MTSPKASAACRSNDSSPRLQRRRRRRLALSAATIESSGVHANDRVESLQTVGQRSDGVLQHPRCCCRAFGTPDCWGSNGARAEAPGRSRRAPSHHGTSLLAAAMARWLRRRRPSGQPRHERCHVERSGNDGDRSCPLRCHNRCGFSAGGLGCRDHADEHGEQRSRVHGDVVELDRDEPPRSATNAVGATAKPDRSRASSVKATLTMSPPRATSAKQPRKAERGGHIKEHVVGGFDGAITPAPRRSARAPGMPGMQVGTHRP